MRMALIGVLVLGAFGSGALAKDMTGTADDDLLRGSEGADRIEGLAGNDELFGIDGDDVLSGGEGDDELFGGHGDDEIDGGAGDDFLDGREGNDRLTGGPGRDLFAYYADTENGADTISDFDPSEDRIVLSEIDPAAVTTEAEDGNAVLVLPGGGGRITLLGVAELAKSEVLIELGDVIR